MDKAAIAQLTPMMQQYMQVKQQVPDCILFYRLGDFYEMFFEDAELASRELELTLTGRECGLEKRAPMCGVPYHAADSYLARLVEKGYKVAICEQLTDPAESKGLVERGIVRIVTPGTITDGSLLEDKKNAYIVSLFMCEDTVGIAVADVTTGEFSFCELAGDVESRIADELARIRPGEIIVNDTMYLLSQQMESLAPWRNHAFFCYQGLGYGLINAADLCRKHFPEQMEEIQKIPAAMCAAGGLLEYLEDTQKCSLNHINHALLYRQESYLMLDATARRNLELTEPIRGNSRKGTLMHLLDKTGTAMGARMLRGMIEQPLQDVKSIHERLDAVEELMGDFARLEDLREALDAIYDIERLTGRIAYQTVHARDCVALMNSLERVPQVMDLLGGCSSALLARLRAQIDPMEEVVGLLKWAIADDPPLSITDGEIIRPGYSQQLDRLREAATNGKQWLAQLESREREETGIKNLKVGFNKVFGYFIEVTRSNLSLVPYRYVRRQTLANCERYITPELKEMEETILGSQEKSIRLEYQLFLDIRGKLLEQVRRLQDTAAALAMVDALHSLAKVALDNNYVKPQVHRGHEIDIQDGRHPVVEAALGGGRFVPNNTLLDQKENRLLIITGPNMAGKSTYMRQTALIVLMAHMGSFVPAASARIGLVDRIFTRVGASDDLSQGQSTFMVEMSEVSNILKHATGRSLLILDEIGRGTSTFDGLSIAWAVVEYLHAHALGKTLFATHYHELSELEGQLAGVKNYCVTVKEYGDEIIFLRKIARGGADKSFGIQVAQLAGLPEEVVARAHKILARLEAADINRPAVGEVIEQAQAAPAALQVNLFHTPEQEVIQELRQLDLNAMTPLDAINALARLQKLSKEV